MATKGSGRQKKKHSDSRLNDLMERLSAHFSQEEIQKIFGRSLLALDAACLERMAAGLETETAARIRTMLRSLRLRLKVLLAKIMAMFDQRCMSA